MAKLQRVLAVLFLCLAPALFAQSADQEVVSVVDSPDPVTPGSTLTYTVTLRNNGPDPATNGGLNINLPGGVTHTTDVVPAGWTCFWAGANGTCNTASFAPSTVVLTINVTVEAYLANFPDQSIVANFFPSGTTPDPNNANNGKTATTLVDAPQADLLIFSATDNPDPVAPDGQVTYGVTVRNDGPDSASSVNFNVVPNSSLSFVSSTEPAGWDCTFPAVGAVNATFTCSRATWAPGSSDFDVVYAANDEQFGINDTTFQVNFSVNGVADDVNDGNNVQSVTTAYVTPDADVEISVTDSPDPVFPDGTITYTVEVSNNGPDPATNAVLNVYNSSGLGFVSVTEPAGWTCTEPAPGAFVQFSCTNPSLAVGVPSVFTVVATTDTVYYGTNEGTISTAFSAGSSRSDPNNGNNQEQEDTAYVTPDADLTVAATDSPDPVGRDEDITYMVTVENDGPDSAAATLNVPMNGFLKFTSHTVPAGFVCTGVPAPGAASSYSCTDTTFASGDSAVFTIVMHTDPATFGINDGVINQPFTVTGNVTDPNNDNNQVNVSTTYDVATANVGVTATDAPDPVNAGSNITYTGTVSNAGPDAAPSVTLTIPLHPNLLFQSLTGPAGFSCTSPAVGANGTITCTMASLPNPSSIGFTLVAQVNPSVANGPDGIIEQGFLIGSSAGETDTTNNELDVFTQYLTPDADISVTNSDTPDPVAPGGAITYTQTLTNNGPDTAVNVVFSETLPATVAFVSLVPAAGYTCTTPAVGASGLISCTRASLVSGGTGTFTLVVDVLATSGTIGNTVTGDSDTYDPDPTDNTATVSTTVLAAASADLSVSKNTNTTAASPGTDIVYTIVVTNDGPDDATSVVLTDTLPAQLQFRSITEPAGFDCVTPAVGATGTITCTAATLADGASATFTLTARVAPGATSGNITNSASATSATGDSNGGNSSGSSGTVTLAASVADVSIVKNTASATAPAGSTFSYTIAVTNSGPNTATNVVMTDVLPAQLLFESIAIPTGFTCTTPAVGTNGTITCTAATLANAVTRTFTLNVRVASGSTSGNVTNSAGVASSSADPDGGDTSDPAPPVTLAPASADLSITKTTSSPTAPTGGTLTYTITVTNAGPSAATGVVVTDTLPAGLQLISATPSQGTCSGTTTVTCNLGTINNGSNATISLQTLVTATSGTISNSASVTSTVADPDGGDTSTSTPPIPIGDPADGVAIPTMSEWALMALAAMLGLLAVMKMKS
ncbi:MAG TPA: IPTL-CTERM sorting domain-containing protein [Thermoanaerobaculia bacterium]|nr:IPTL-CTERM sorting domain-containing protein [Thermoanaerobaculia bacterium]